MQRKYYSGAFSVILLAGAALALGMTAAAPASRPHPSHSPRPSHAGLMARRAHPVIGDGTPASCTSAAVVKAVAQGGLITFDCGPGHVTITMTATARVPTGGHRVVLDGGGRITLRGSGGHRLLSLDTCGRGEPATGDCHDQRWPRLAVENIVLERGDAPGGPPGGAAPGGGGAIFDRGGELTVTNSVFAGNHCAAAGADAGGGSIHVLDQWHGRPVQLSNDVFRDSSCAAGGALAGAGVSWQIANSVFSGNAATSGGGGALYADGSHSVAVANSVFRGNRAHGSGGAIFFRGDDASASLTIGDSVLIGNPEGNSETGGYAGIYYSGHGSPAVSGSVIG